MLYDVMIDRYKKQTLPNWPWCIEYYEDDIIGINYLDLVYHHQDGTKTIYKSVKAPYDDDAYNQVINQLVALSEHYQRLMNSYSAPLQSVDRTEIF